MSLQGKRRLPPKALWFTGLVFAGVILAVVLLRPKTPRALSTAPPPSTIAEKTAPAGGGSLLDEMAPKKDGLSSSDLSGRVPTDRELEKQFLIVSENQRQVNELKARSAAAMQAHNAAGVSATAAQGKQQVTLLNLRLTALQADLNAARRARPEDSTVQWLTGELLLIVGGEPAEIRPYLERAVSAGLKQPALFSSLAKVELESSHLQAAYNLARKALEGDPHNESIWDTYAGASFAIERFEEVIQELDKIFPANKPDWAAAMRSQAEQLLAEWKRELSLRQAENKRGNLPLVRFTIEHRSFANAAPDGQARSSSAAENNTGRGVVELELFEDQAPSTVANFVNLVEHGFYNGTRFHLAEGGRLVAGGDPNTKGENRAADGSGGPGYFIPDESQSASARGHFRGSISMAQRGPGTAGSQFVVTLVPSPELNGHFTVFGRVTAGQDVIDQITTGRTNRSVGEFGKIIPGDVLVRAEVIRKRPHKYEVTKLAR